MYLAGRRFTFLTDCAALTWLFKSRDLSPKLQRWALQMMEYDVVLQWRPGVLPSAPDAFSRLPPEDGTTPRDVDTSFPGDPPEGQSIYSGPHGPVYEQEILDERYPAGVSDDGKRGTFPVSALFMSKADKLASLLGSGEKEAARLGKSQVIAPPYAVQS